MSELDTVREVLDFDRRVLDRFIAKAGRLQGDAATRRRGSGHETIRATLLHLLQVRDGWLNVVAQGRVHEFDTTFHPPRDQDLRSWSDLEAYRDRVWAGVEEFFGSLSEADLRRPVKAPWMAGEYTLRDAFFQVSYEEAHHLGEVIALMWQIDSIPPAMTWIEIRRDLRLHPPRRSIARRRPRVLRSPARTAPRRSERRRR